MLNVVNAPRVIGKLLVDFHDLDEFRRVAVQVTTMLPGFARRLRASVHRQCPRPFAPAAGASLVLSPIMAITCRLPVLADARQLVLRLGLRDEIIHARPRRRWRSRSTDCCRRVISDGLDAHLAQLREAFLMPPFDDVPEVNDTERAGRYRSFASGVPPEGDFIHLVHERFFHLPAAFLHVAGGRIPPHLCGCTR